VWLKKSNVRRADKNNGSILIGLTQFNPGGDTNTKKNRIPVHNTGGGRFSIRGFDYSRLGFYYFYILNLIFADFSLDYSWIASKSSKCLAFFS